MPDYVAKLRSDLVEQFKKKPVIDALMEAIGEQFNDLYRFFADLKTKRSVLSAFGKQLDGIGNVVVLSRKEAAELACINEPIYALADEEYRKYLIYKIWKNTCGCTYPDIIKAFKMFWNKPLYYSEDPSEPATMIIESSELTPEDNAHLLLNAPFIKAAGVRIIVIAHTCNGLMEAPIGFKGVLGCGYMSTTLPEIPIEIEMQHTAKVVPARTNVAETILPEMEVS